MLQLCDSYDEEEMKKILAQDSKANMKNHLRKKKTKGGGF